MEGRTSIRPPRASSHLVDARPDEGIARALDRLTARASSTHEPTSSTVPRQMPAPSVSSAGSTAVPTAAPSPASAIPLTSALADSSIPSTTTPLSPPQAASPVENATTSTAQQQPMPPQSMPPQATAQQPTTAFLTAIPSREKRATDGGVGANEAPADSRSSWQSALPRELRELGMSPAPHPELARRHNEAMLGTLAERVMMLRAAGQSAASVTLEPESLGRVDVHVRLHAETTHLSFTVQHAAVRDVVEANLPRLRTMLEDAGLTLGDVNVGHSDQGSRQPRFEPERRHADGPTLARDDAPSSHRITNDRLVDVRV
jgi:flagellar hook-length control protein FliK